MAHHFIPQYYLKGFTVTRKHYLYVFEKGTQKYCELPIKSIGCRSKYYSQNIEQHLANSVENPANKIIRKIRNKEAISKNEKEIFSRYITSMWKRVPSWKGKFKERAPAVSEKLKKELTYSLDNYVQANPQKQNK